MTLIEERLRMLNTQPAYLDTLPLYLVSGSENIDQILAEFALDVDDAGAKATKRAQVSERKVNRHKPSGR